MKNFLSFDLEFWHSGEPYSNHLPKKIMNNIEEDVRPLLNILKKHNTTATFFTLGNLAEKYPDLIKEIHENGHEIASHGYSHKRLYELGPDNFEREIKKSINLIKSITNITPIGFRAPYYSLTNSTIWALSILTKYNFKYDSSILPVTSHLQSDSNPPRIPYKISMDDVTKVDEHSKLCEFPLCSIRFLYNIPFSIGVYLRIFPFGIYKMIIKKNNKRGPITFCIHPWECNPKTSRLNLFLPLYFCSYYGIRLTLKKIDKLLKEFDFVSIKEVI
ncbi:hypothetical protein AYK24_07210 [Thermoplasmatales archaeon SG8-52-4]|nr:MAG: hypothetical protein AYK24_07210 [Thermoplasmatales archaeon SG8-52-4]